MATMSIRRDFPVRTFPIRICAGALLAAAIAVLAPARASAEVRVIEAGAQKLTIEARGATVREVLDALHAKRMIEFNTSEALSGTVTGTYSGAPRSVLGRILEGYNHIIQVTESGLRVSIFRAAGTANPMTSVAHATFVAPNAGHAVSHNVDLDEEKVEATAGTRATGAVASPPPASVPAAMMGAPRGRARISSNVDLDEETSR
jgi:type II secretory pathway component GspD/PulD (secretin)